MRKEVILQAIIEANKLGFKQVEVIDYIESDSATEDDRLRLVTIWGGTDTTTDSVD